MTWTIVVTTAHIGTIVLALTLGRRRRGLTYAAMLTLMVVAIVGFSAVQNSTGYVSP